MKIYNTRNEMLKELVAKNMTIVEIGVFKGEFAKFLLSLMPSTLYLVDCWENSTICSGNVDGNFMEYYNGYELYKNLYEEFKDNSNVKICRTYSNNFLLNLEDNSIDIIYIDGDHSYHGVKKDLELSYHKIKSGGLIMGHDYEMNMEKAHHVYDFGVKRAVDEFCKYYGLDICAKALDGCVSFCIKKS